MQNQESGQGWSEIEARIADNDLQAPNGRRQQILKLIRDSDLIPNGGATKYMVGFLFRRHNVVVWELSGQARNFFVAAKWQGALERTSLTCEPRPYEKGQTDGGRHSALNRSWSFPQEDCLCVKINQDQDFRNLLSVIGSAQSEQDGILDRKSVEAAMDAMDQGGDNEERVRLSDRFDAAVTTWVRSTRNRNGRVYPTMAIVCRVLGSAGLTDGWSEKTDAAARLHNAGFIVVDAENDPLQPPEGVDHLLRDAERIRLCAYHYFIEPEREKNASQVEIRAGDLAKAMGLKDALPNVCQVLGGRKFQQLARVPAPSHTEPNPSSSTTFTFRLKFQHKAVEVTKATAEVEHSANNLILYGPPGTGKTYTTAEEAVRLCDGERPTAEPDAVRRRYDELVRTGQIRFVTFHQSYAYEDFVEGLRPTTGETEDGLPSAGFRLVPKPGIFREIATLAEQARKAAAGERRGPVIDLAGRQFWKMALGAKDAEEHVYQAAVAGGYVALGWGGDVDFSDPRFAEIEAVKQEWRTHYADDTTPSHISQPWTFRNAMKVGDIVIVPYGNTAYRAVAQITGDYYFELGEDGTYNHRRKVRWLLVLDEPLPLDTIVEGNFTMRTLYELPRHRIRVEGLQRLIGGPPQIASPARADQFVLIIDEINRANVSKVFGELITLLEPDKRLGQDNALTVTLPYSGDTFGVPDNLHVIGTMNTADRSIALLDTALRRRFAFRELEPQPERLQRDVEGIDLTAVLSALNARIEYLVDREHRIGHAFFMLCRTRADIDAVMRNRVIPLLAEYFFEDWERIRLVLGEGETRDQGAFLNRTRLKPPRGLEDHGPDRWSYAVRETFAEDAYLQLLA
ncbi:AAA family ATPase [Methylobacterium oryzihabitans]|uniref:ATPase n=1 Tax=Methylobacterium oryzihabitans TaxID=2499852 RepID=A0A3S2W583_9HYPH|nr:AAA family ATPase [Methylobacterium oryzihabitans]RVU14001.1 ATPase [Methylobacterium oryzihabitans]